MSERRSVFVPLDLPQELPRQFRSRAVAWLPVLALAVLTFVLYPVAGRFDAPPLEAGEVAPSDVVAPFDFVVPKPPAQLAREREALAATVRPIYEYHPAALDSALAAAATLFAALDSAATPAALGDSAQARGVPLSASEAEFLLGNGRRAAYRRAVDQMLRHVLSLGVTAPGQLQSETASEIVLRQQGTEHVTPRDAVLGYKEFLERRRAYDPNPHAAGADPLFVKVLNAVFRPTLVPNVAETDQQRAELRASVDTIMDRVRQNERIVGEHELVTPDAHDRLMALRAEIVRRGGTERSIASAAGQILNNAMLLSIFWLLLLLYRRESYGNLRHVLLFATLFGLVIVGAALSFRFLTQAPELIPIPFAAMLMTVLFSGRVAMVGAAVLAVLLVPSEIGIVWALFAPERQFLHDRLAGTRLVSVPR